MAFTYCIYYRVSEPGRASTLARRVLAAVESGTGITGRLLRRRDDPSTWMEIYEGVADADAFERCLGAILQTADFNAILAGDGVRHFECFEDACA